MLRRAPIAGGLRGYHLRALPDRKLLVDPRPTIVRGYKRFIVSGENSHTALQGPLFFGQTANGVPLNEWTAEFLVPTPFWVDIVEDFVPLP